METQCQRLINHLEAGKTITSMQAWRQLGFSYLPVRIKEVKNMGYNIKSRRKHVLNRFKEQCSVNVYWLED